MKICIKTRKNISKIQDPVPQFTWWLGIYFACLVVGALAIGPFGSALRMITFIPILIWVVKKHKIILSKGLVGALPFIFWCAFTILWSIDIGSSINRAISHIMFAAVLMAASGYVYTEKEISYLKKMLVWSSRITAIVTLSMGSYVSGRLWLSGVISEDPNYLCAYFIFGAVYCLSVVLSQCNVKKKCMAIFELLVYIYIIFATGSRGGLFAVSAALIVDLLTYGDEHSLKSAVYKRRLFASLFIIVMVIFVTELLPQNIASRFTLEAIRSSKGTGRFELWQDAFNAYENSNFLRKGVGYGTGTARLITYLFPFHRHNVFHNVFVENLLEIGIIGLCLYCLHIVTFVFMALKHRDSFQFSVIMGLIVMSLSTSIYTFKPYWNIMIFILCCDLKDRKNFNLNK